MRLAAIVAATPDLIIGAGGGIPWDSPQDRAHFRRITDGKPLILGRTTFDSLPRPLPGRRLIVLTRRPLSPEAARVAVAADTPKAAIAAAERMGSDEVMVAGGARVYAAFEREVETIYWSRVHADVDDPDPTLFPFDPFRDPRWRTAARWSWRGGVPAVDYLVLTRR